MIESSVPYSLLIDHAKIPSAKTGDYIVGFTKKPQFHRVYNKNKS